MMKTYRLLGQLALLTCALLVYPAAGYAASEIELANAINPHSLDLGYILPKNEVTLK